jgi:GrpB-like predicted nucleotidyltransferase (UPF0157 family)
MRDDLGLDSSEVRLAAPNRAWVVLADAECRAVEEQLAGLARAVEHVGSTSVPGLEAKPILDLAAAVPDGAQAVEVVARLDAGGRYSYMGDMGKDGGLLFVRSNGSFRTVHVHVVHEGSQEWDDYVRFRELLRREPVARQLYQSAKRKLALRFPRDRQGYTEAKSAVVEELLDAERRHAAAHAG